MIKHSEAVTDFPEVPPLRLRWEKATRFYKVHVEQDLWGGRVLPKTWGRRGTALGQVRRAPCESYGEAVDRLAAVRKQREGRGYAVVESCQNPELHRRRPMSIPNWIPGASRT